MKALFLLLMASCAFAQPPDTLWTRMYDFSDDYEYPRDLQSDPNGGWILAGSWFNFESERFYVMRLDEQGDTTWTAHEGWGSSVRVANNGGYFVSGSIAIGQFSASPRVIRMDENGDTLWTTSIGGSGSSAVSNAVEASDGHCFALRSTDFAPRFRVAKITEDGVVLWTRQFEISLAEGGAGGITSTPDGGCAALVVRQQSSPFYWGRPLVVRLNAEGDSLWSFTTLDSNYEMASEIFALPGGDFTFAVAHYLASEGYHAQLFRLSAAGVLLELHDLGHYGYVHDMAYLGEAGFAVMGDQTLLRVSVAGDTLWTKMFSELPVDHEYSCVAADNDGGFMLCGRVEGDPWPSDSSDTKLFRMDTERPLIIDTVFAAYAEPVMTVHVESLWEWNCQALHLWRGESQGGDFVEVASQDAANDVNGTEYTFDDETVAPGQICYYFISASNISGRVWEYRERMVRATAMSADNARALFPREFSLSAYPNPFNAATTLTFSLPVAVNVGLDLFDVMGRKVMSLAAGRYDAGVHYQTVNGSSLASGLYIAQLISDRYSTTQKLLLLK